MPSNKTGKIGVIIMTYGSATAAEHAAEYLQHIYKDKIPDGLAADFAERYRLVGRSPLVEITQEQAELLGKELDSEGKRPFVVQAGMLHSHPFIAEAVQNCREAGAERLVGVILSPQFSTLIMQGYHTALQAAAAQHGYTAKQITIAQPWPAEPHFIDLLAKRTEAALDKLRPRFGSVPVVFTTHSLPERVVAKDPHYLDQLQTTAEAVVSQFKKPDLDWYRAYQSAGHTPETWLKPDLVDILADLRDKHSKAVLIVPIQFLADHLEILYDLDIAAREQCEAYNISYNRIELPNTDPLFVMSLAATVRSTLR